MGWRTYTKLNDSMRITSINIIPTNDTDSHIHNSKCACHPKIDYENNIKIILHNSFDGREKIESLIYEAFNNLN